MTVLLTALDHALHLIWVGQDPGIGNNAPNTIQPEAPPGSNGLLKLLRWFMWLVTLAGMTAIMFAGGRFGWEKWRGDQLESPKMVVGALIGGILAVSAGSIINAVVLTGS